MRNKATKAYNDVRFVPGVHAEAGDSLKASRKFVTGGMVGMQYELEQLERLRPETPSTAPWLPILMIHIRSQVKQDQVKETHFTK